MAELWIPAFTEAAGQTWVIDGRTYRPALIDSSGRLIVVGPGAGGAQEAIQDTPDDLRAAVYGIEGSTQRQVLVDPDARLVVTLDQDADDYRTANETYAAAQANNELVAAPGAGIIVYVVGLQFSTEVAGSVKLTQSSGTPADVWGPHFFPANGGISLAPSRPIAVLNANSALRVTTDVAGDHTITVQALVA